jgi:centrosomal protein CEP95
MDVLNTSLSHITGEAVVNGDPTAIANLLDVFSGLLEYMLDKIGSDASSILSRAYLSF